MDQTERRFELRVLGSPALTDASGATPEALGWGKPLALLCLLSVRDDLRRDEVVDLLWRGVDEGKARNAFRQALHRLRNAVGDAVIPSDRERLRRAKSSTLGIDLERFEAAIDAGRFDDAVAIYGGDFLHEASLGEPAFDLWVEQERARIRARFRVALERAMSQAAARGDWDRTVRYARRLMLVAPFEPESALLAASAMVSAGQAREAHDLLVRFVSRRESELGVGITPEIKAMMSRLERSLEAALQAPAGVAPQPMSFAGREAELARLLALWREVGQDGGALALIEGDVGMGRSRLMQEFAAHAKALRPAVVLVAHERIAPTPLGLFADALRPLVRASGIAGASPHLLAEAARLLPELRDSMELPAVSDVDDEAARLRFFEGVAALMDAASYERPVLLVLEDLEHAPPSSLDLLSYLVSRLAGSAVMFALTVRSGAVVAARLSVLAEPPGGGTPPHGPRALRLVLAPLSREASARALAGSPGAASFDADIVDRVCRESGGVPAMLVDLSRRALSGEAIGTAIEPTVALTATVEGLSSAHRRVLTVLALLRRPASLELVASASHLSRSAARDAIRFLESDRLVAVDERQLISSSAEVAECVLGLTGSDARAFLSRWIAAALAAEPRAEPSELARFHAAGGETTRAFESYRRAAFDSLALGARVEAVAFLTHARQFAATAEQQSEVEGLLSGLGSGKRRLPTTPPASPRAAPGVGSSRWRQLFPNWRLLLGGAVATLLVSALVLWRTPAGAPVRNAPADTLLVTEGEPARALRRVTFDDGLHPILAPAEALSRPMPGWVDSVPRTWTAAVVSPRGTHVAFARATPAGRDVILLGADRRDTISFTTGSADARPLGWSPDGRWLLANVGRTLGNGAFDSDLIAFSVADASNRVVIDTSADRAIVEARWAPDGTHVGWVARVGVNRQLEVFLAAADGSGRRNVSRNPADDYHIAWSGDGGLLAYTSTRDGNAELYAYSLPDDKTWRLTRDPAQDDWPVYTATGRWIAFESTREGTAGVYVMPGLGGAATRIEGVSAASIVGWRSGTSRYVNALRVVPSRDAFGADTIGVRVLALDQFGDSMATTGAAIRVLDPPGARAQPAAGNHGNWMLLGVNTGIARVLTTTSGWRSDTVDVRVGQDAIALLNSRDARAFGSTWIALGEPRPAPSRGGGYSLNADQDWESGLLSRQSVPLLPELELSVVVDASERSPARDATFSVSWVAPESPANVDAVAPQFLRYASFLWNVDAKRRIYSVGREVFSEVAGEDWTGRRLITIRVEPDSTVSFEVDGVRRWRSSLRLVDTRHAPGAQAWISAHGTDGTLILREASVRLRAVGDSGRERSAAAHRDREP